MRTALARTANPAWLVTLIVLIIDASWIAVGNWTVTATTVVATSATVAALLVPMCFTRYRNDVRISATLSVAALLILYTSVGAVFSYLVVSTNASLVDARLATWDQAIGFDWLALFGWMQANPSIHTALKIAYGSGLAQMACAIVILGFTARTAQLNEFINLFIATTLIAIAISWPFPAAGPWTHFSLSTTIDVSAMSHFPLLRDGSLRTLDAKGMQGLISIPSVHAATALLLAYAMRGTRLFAAFAVLSSLMILATPIDGGHYLVDVLAGAALAIALIAFSRVRQARGLKSGRHESTMAEQRLQFRSP